MLALAFELGAVPDLTLSKYAALGARGVDGVLETHLAFLRLFAHRPNTSLHLFYSYDPSRADGERLSVHLVVALDDEEGAVGLGDVEQIVLSSSLAHFFDLRARRPPDGGFARPGQLVGMVGPRGHEGAPMRYGWCAAVSKGSRFMRTAENPTGYFVTLPYEGNDGARLYAMMSLMGNLDLPVALRVDLYPSDRAATLRDSLPLDDVWRRASRSGLARDYALDLVERSYEDLLDSLEGSPLFHLNAVAFAPDGEVARALLDAAASEAVGRGSLDINVYEGAFDALSLMGPLPEDEVLSSEGSPRAVVVARRREANGPLPGFVQVNARARSYAQYDICNLFTLEEAACLFRLPTLNEGEAIQLRKETAPHPVDAHEALLLGADEFGQRAYFELSKLSKHAFVSGVPGSGKTNTMLHMATSLVNRGVPILVLEPAKHEYRALLNADLAQEVRVFSPGGEAAFPLRINPLQVPCGVTIGQHISRLCAAFEASFPLTESLPFLLDRAVESVYAAHGWRSKDRVEAGDPRGWPTLSELYAQTEAEISSESYAGEVRGNLTAVLRVRIGGLLRRELGELFDVPVSTFEPNEWLGMSAVIELEALGHAEANFLTLLLLVLVRECLMARGAYEGELPVRHVIFIEEAHNLVAPKAEAQSGENADPKLAATAFLADMLREVRAYSEGIVVADQLPTAIAPEVLKNTGLKVALRMTSADDRQLLGSMMAAGGAQLERMATANPGGALVLYEGLQRPFEIRMAEWLGVPGTREYVEGRERRSEAASSPDGAELSARLIESDAPWYRLVRVSVPGDDAAALTAELERIDQLYALALEALDRLDRELASVVEDAEAYERLNAEVDRDLHLALGTYPTDVRGEPVAPDLSPILRAYRDADRAFRERARGWAGLGLPLFSQPDDVTLQTLAYGRLDAVTYAAVLKYLSGEESYSSHVLRLYAGGAGRFGLTFDRGRDVRGFEDQRQTLQGYVDAAGVVLPRAQGKRARG